MKSKTLFTILLAVLVSQAAIAQEYTHYLLAYFTGNAVSQEQIRYALGTDGSHFEALNGGNPLIESSQISLSGGVRDPFIVRGHDDGYFYMTVTDMKSSLGWSSNRGLTILRSRDLINWEHHIFHFPTLFPSAWSNVTRVWAPEIIWDNEAGRYLIYYSLLSGSLSCDKLFYSYVTFADNPDEWTIEEPQPMFCYRENGQERATIDANIIQRNGLYYMFFKTEDSEKRIRLHHSSSLTDWSAASTANVAQNPGEAEEGACCFQLIGQDKWIYMSDLYGRSTATFRQRTTTDFVNFTSIGNLSGVSPRHGSVIWLTDDETRRLEVWSDLRQMLDDNADLASADAYKAALDAIRTGDAATMEAARKAFADYLDASGANATLRNANFDNGVTGWTYSGNCVPGGDRRNPCVEAFNCDFDFHQKLTGLENGYYKLSVQAFQRTRSNSYGFNDYQNDNADVTTWIYTNSVQKAVKNVFAEATNTAYTWGTPYTNAMGTYTPDNMASASEAFSRGMYENAIGVEVTDGTLVVGIKSAGGTSSSRWSIWDNFRLERTDTLYTGEGDGGTIINPDPIEPEPDTCTLIIDAAERGATIEPTQYGIFYEEINFAGDGGLYAELVRNRSFEQGTDYWHPTGANTISTLNTLLLNSAQGAQLNIVNKAKGEGVYNDGYWGMNIVEGQAYHLTFFVKRGSKISSTITATLQDAAGRSLGETQIPITLTTKWQKVDTTIVATASAPNGRLSLTADLTGNWQIDVVSLFPPTFKERANGCRKDLAQLLYDMKPAFVRFPGGCYVEGSGDIVNQNRFEWKKTIGPIEERRGHFNRNWGYPVTDGMGYQEFLNLCEDLGAEPLFVCNIGLGHGYSTGNSEEDLRELIDEALDAIEFANGDTTTTYGRLRALYGHPEPYNMRMIEIGNENNQDFGAYNADYYIRYDRFRKAILERFPYMYLIGNVAAWGTDTPLWYSQSPVESVDEHYYRDPDWFAARYHHYDHYSRDHKVYCGEYAVTSDYGTLGSLKAALGEAIFMLGMERNSDVVNMTSYAPIFVNENAQGWMPDMIRFNASESFGTPSYYVQQMFPNHVGTQNVDFTLADRSISAKDSKVGVATWNTAASYSNLKWTDADGKVISTGTMTNSGGTWTSSAGTYTQTNAYAEGARIISTEGAPTDGYTLNIKARKTAGGEGFLIIFDWKDERNYCWWNLGGWNNTTQAIERCVNGNKTSLTTAASAIATDRDYDLRVEYYGGVVRCYIDDQLALTAEVGASLYANCNIDQERGRLYAKVVNYGSKAKELAIHVKGAKVDEAQATVLTAPGNYAENTMVNKYNVSPAPADIALQSDTTLTYTVPAYSVSALDFDVSDIVIPSAIDAPVGHHTTIPTEVYGLDGIRRQSSRALPRGIYVKDGRKIIVR